MIGPDLYWKRDENEHLTKFSCRTNSPQLQYKELLKRIVRATGDCAREDCHAVYRYSRSSGRKRSKQEPGTKRRAATGEPVKQGAEIKERP
ncbi:MAG TPA: hypothetical protein DEB39_12520 [Planctomycetaceae bacterium]|nr:hypothetical protein [Planctomycetaceae bacterium]